jgi:predicted anti-sigma-YlaC factor YlaD
MKLSLDVLKKIVGALVGTKPIELDCDECFEQVDLFVDLRLQGKDTAEAMPLLQDHLTRCGACREEFEALLDCIRATTE